MLLGPANMKLLLVIFGLNILYSSLGLPVQDVPLFKPENCIEMTPAKEREVTSIIEELSDYLNKITLAHEDIDIRLLKLGVDNHSEDEVEDKDVTLQLLVNDCTKDKDLKKEKDLFEVEPVEVKEPKENKDIEEDEEEGSALKKIIENEIKQAESRTKERNLYEAEPVEVKQPKENKEKIKDREEEEEEEEEEGNALRKIIENEIKQAESRKKVRNLYEAEPIEVKLPKENKEKVKYIEKDLKRGNSLKKIIEIEIKQAGNKKKERNLYEAEPVEVKEPKQNKEKIKDIEEEEEEGNALRKIIENEIKQAESRKRVRNLYEAEPIEVKLPKENKEKVKYIEKDLKEGNSLKKIIEIEIKQAGNKKKGRNLYETEPVEVKEPKQNKEKIKDIEEEEEEGNALRKIIENEIKQAESRKRVRNLYEAEPIEVKLPKENKENVKYIEKDLKEGNSLKKIIEIEIKQAENKKKERNLYEVEPVEVRGLKINENKDFDQGTDEENVMKKIIENEIREAENAKNRNTLEYEKNYEINDDVPRKFDEDIEDNEDEEFDEHESKFGDNDDVIPQLMMFEVAESGRDLIRALEKKRGRFNPLLVYVQKDDDFSKYAFLDDYYRQ